MRFTAALLSGIILFAGSGCAVVVATTVAVGAVTTASVKTAGKVTAATVTTTGRMASAALKSGGKMTALDVESAAKLARNGMVVLVDGSTGVVAELPWRQGLQLYAAVQSGCPGINFSGARIFRGQESLMADLKKRSVDLVLRPRDVVELKH